MRLSYGSILTQWVVNNIIASFDSKINRISYLFNCNCLHILIAYYFSFMLYFICLNTDKCVTNDFCVIHYYEEGVLYLAIRVAINGFGRIGRNVLRVISERNTNDFEVVMINHSNNLELLAHLLTHDSCFGKFDKKVEIIDNGLLVDGKKIVVTGERNIDNIPWAEYDIDLVIESTGKFVDRENAEKHIKNGAKKVIITAPGKNEDVTIVMGVNESQYDPKNHHIISNASCTTNCLAPFTKVLNDTFGIHKGLMTTIHAYTNDQRLLDGTHKDLRRARGAADSIIPTSTGAAKAIGKVIPSLSGLINGISMRVPLSAVSVVDVVYHLKKETTIEEVNNALNDAANSSLKGILGFSYEPLVSIDYKKDPHSSIIDGLSTMMVGSNMVKVVSWYDNEWGYSSRVVDLVQLVAEKM